MKHGWLLTMLMMTAALAAACSTKPVPGVCCLGPEDCGRLGLSEDRPCPQGQACVDLHCVVPACSIQGCAAEAPVCDVTADVCTGCSDAADCSRFGDTDVCNPQTGSCVECLAAADCTAAAEPVCDGGACRGCRLDTECSSGACGEDGACVAEANIIYLHPAGIDTGTCPRSAPCRRIEIGATRASVTRNHIVLAPGLYDSEGELITDEGTPAQRLFIHGGGSVISSPGDGAVLMTQVPVVIRDLELVGNGSGLVLVTTGRSILERFKIRGANLRGLEVGGDVLARDISIEGAGTAITLEFAARLTIDRGLIKSSGIGIQSTSSTATFDITNLLVFGASDVAFDLANSGGGTVSFTTIADSGTDSGTGPRAFRCSSSGLTVRSSIIWAPGTQNRAAIDSGCTLLSTIVGPTAVPGATNVDPLFVDAANRDYRLSANSPARDMVDTGPATDFEGDPRPLRARFDIGADEAP
jgi:hypothetical protein